MGKKMVIVLFIISILLVIIGVSISLSNNHDEGKSEEETIADTDSGKKVKPLTNIMYKLLIWGQEIYDSGDYKSYQKGSRYYITVKELNENYQYDISEFIEENCDIENTIITFDESSRDHYFVSLSGC